MNWQDAFAEELSQEWESAPQEEAPADESVALETGTVVNPTLILKEDASPAPVNYGLQTKQKDMFSPLKLQTMFEPPPNSSRKVALDVCCLFSSGGRRDERYSGGIGGRHDPACARGR
jgi:hypothetical protein